MAYHIASKKTMEINPKHSLMTELKKKAAAAKSDNIVNDLIWLLFDTSLLMSGFKVDEPSHIVCKLHSLHDQVCFEHL